MHEEGGPIDTDIDVPVKTMRDDSFESFCVLVVRIKSKVTSLVKAKVLF